MEVGAGHAHGHSRLWYRLRVLHFCDREAAPATPLSERLRLEPLVLHGSAGRTSLPLLGGRGRCTCRREERVLPERDFAVALTKMG